MSGDAMYSDNSEVTYVGRPSDVLSFDRQSPLYQNAGQLPSITRPEESGLETSISLPNHTFDYTLALPFEKESRA